MMRSLFDRFFGSSGSAGGTVLQVLTPTTVGGRHPLIRAALAAMTAAGLAAASAVAVGSFASLLMALAVIYFLATVVLGVRLDLDPRAFVEQAQAYARQSHSH